MRWLANFARKLSLHAYMVVLILSFSIYILATEWELPAAASITNGANAIDVLGQYDQTDFDNPVETYTKSAMNDGPNILGFTTSDGMAIDTVHHRFFVVDTGSNRVLVYNLNTDQTFPDRVPDNVLGQPDFISSSAFNNQSKLNNPIDVAYDSVHDRLFVLQSGANRILVYDVATITDGENAVSVLGQAGFFTGTSATTQAGLKAPTAVEYDSVGDKLYVADSSNNRVVVFDVASITDGENAVSVLGQTLFSTSTAAATQAGMAAPRGLALDSSTNRLFVSLGTQNRILVFDVASITDGENAVSVLGQVLFTTVTSATSSIGFSSPRGLDYDPVRHYLYVAENSNHRVLIFDVASITNGESAINVLGQPDFTTAVTGVTQSKLSNTYAVAFDPTSQRLYAADNGSNRIMVFDVAGIVNGEDAVDVLGQYDDTSYTNPQPVYTKSGKNNGPNRFGYTSSIRGIAFDTVHHRLFVSDSSNYRVLVYNLNNDLSLPDKIPDYVLGQSTLGAQDDAGVGVNSINKPAGLAYDGSGDKLYVADSGNNRILVFDTATIWNGESAVNVLGQANFFSAVAATSASQLHLPLGLAYSSTGSRLFVSDTINNRVMVFDVAAITNGENAVKVLGQSGFGINSSNTSQSGMSGPRGLAYNSSGNKLYVSDTSNNRVLVYDVASISDGENAVNVLGQTDFANSTAATTQLGLSNPEGLAYDSARQRLFVADKTNSRAIVYDVASITDGENAVNVLGQPNYTTSSASTTQDKLSTPFDVAFEPTNRRLYVLDSGNSRVMVFDARTEGFTLGSTTASLTEGGASTTVSVQLVSAPSSNVVLSIGSSDTGAATASPASMTFTTGNWNTPQNITIAPVIDADVLNESVTITVSINDASSDDNFDALPDQTIAVTVTDPDVPPAPAIISPTASGYSTGTISGTGVVGSSVAVTGPSASSCLTTVDGSGNWSCALSPAPADGTNGNVSATQTYSGKTSAASAAVNFTIDIGAPSAPTISAPVAASVTSDATPTVSGTAEASSTVVVVEGATTLCSTTADGGGDWSCTSSSLSDGSHTITATATDGAGNAGSASGGRTFTVDATAPGAPVISSPVAASVTSDATPTVSGTAEADSAVVVREGGSTLCSATADGAGDWSCDSSALSDGSHTITATATDGAGNAGSASAGRTFSVDTAAPAVPTISAPVVASVTSDATPTVSGTAEASSTVTVVEDATTLCSTAADGGGDWSCTSSSLSDGAHTITATATDAAGNAGSASAGRTFTVDTTVPGVPVISSPTAASSVSDATPTIAGTAEADSTVTVVEGASTLCSTAADGLGDWSCASSSLTDGAHTITATATDGAGNTGTASAGVSFTVDTLPPGVPVVVSPVGGQLVGSSTPTVSGTAEANSVVVVRQGVAMLCSATVDGAGDWSCVTGNLSDGSHTVTARATDMAGNVGTASAGRTFTTDGTVPVAPTISAPPASGYVSDSTPTVSGTAEANSVVVVRQGVTMLCLVSANGSGNWSCASSALSDGSHTITAYATDLAGNSSGDSAERTFTVDTIAPVVPVVISPVNGFISADATPTVSGTAEAGTTVTVREGGTPLCSGVADGVGDWSCSSSSLVDGSYVITAIAVDLAGNASSASIGISFVVDAISPIAPTMIVPVDGSVISDATPTVSGTAEADSTVTVAEGATTLCSTTADGGGDWSCTSSSLSDGSHTIMATATDGAGNSSLASSGVTFDIDDTSPAAPTISAPGAASVTSDATPTVSGTAEADSSVVVREGATTLCSTTADGAGDWSCTSSSLSDGAHTITATATDGAGNAGSASAGRTFSVDTAAPAVPVISSPTAASSISDETPTVSGTSEADSSITVLEGATTLCSATADGGGDWSCTSSSLSDGSHTITATATDGAGNAGGASGGRTFTVDTVAPAAPVINTPANGSSISDSTPTISGTAEADSTVTAVEGVTIVCTTTTGGGGDWSCVSSTLSDGSRTITATATDAAGNTGAAGAAVSFILDATSPGAPVISAPGSGVHTSSATPTISGTAEVGSAVTVSEGATTLCTTIADGLGDWSCTSSSLTDGLHTITATATDGLGNASAPRSRSFTVDTSAPAAPAINTPAAGAVTTDSTPAVAGIAEPGSTINVYANLTLLCVATTSGSGNWSCTSTNLNIGSYTITSTATDAAGNTGASSAAVSFTVIASAAPHTDTDSDGDPNTLDVDDDGDAVPDAVEDTAFNGGDGNNDGIKDSLQDIVTSIRNSVTGGSTTLQSAMCSIKHFAIVDVSRLRAVDRGYRYPAGMVSFQLSCPRPGATATVTVIYDRHVAVGSVKWRKLNGSAFSSVNSAQITSVPSFRNVTRVVYQITDGGSFDTDGVANGSIVDPAGLAVRQSALVTTGMALLTMLIGALGVIAASSGWLIRRHRKRRLKISPVY